jgi:hypothetical protein
VAKMNKRVNWYKNPEKTEIKYKSVLFVPPTYCGVLVKELKKREHKLGQSCVKLRSTWG